MGLFRRFIQRKASHVDARRWSLVAHLVQPDEIPMFNTPCKLMHSDGTTDGFILLSDQAFYTVDAGLAGRMPLEEIHEINPLADHVFRIVFGGRDAQGGQISVIFRMYPSPLSAEFYRHLVGQIETLTGRKVERPIDPAELEAARRRAQNPDPP